MKIIIARCVLLLALISTASAQEVLRPIVSSEFGKPVTVQAEFVAKPNSYYSQNIVDKPYLLRVVAVDGKNLKDPVLIEYKLEAEGKKRAKLERPGAVTSFEAYESLYQPAFAMPWLAEGQQGMSFSLSHVLHIRLPGKKG